MCSCLFFSAFAFFVLHIVSFSPFSKLTLRTHDSVFPPFLILRQTESGAAPLSRYFYGSRALGDFPPPSFYQSDERDDFSAPPIR